MAADEQLQKVNQDLTQTVSNITHLSHEVAGVQSSLGRSINQLQNAFTNESTFRRKMLQTLKDILEENKNAQKQTSSNHNDHENMAKKWVDDFEEHDQSCQMHLKALQMELDRTFEWSQTLEQKTQTYMTKQKQLQTENDQLVDINRQYQSEIEQQSAMLQTIHIALNKLTQNIDSLKLDVNQMKQMTAYSSDTLTGEIGQDIMFGNDFEQWRQQVKQNALNESTLSQLTKMIQDKWVQQTQQTISDIDQILRSSNKAIGSTKMEWLHYQQALKTWLEEWKQQGPSWVQKWAQNVRSPSPPKPSIS